MSRGKEKSLGTITRNRAIKIFEALGFKTASKWDTARLQKKLIKLDVLVGGTELDNKTQKRVGEILRAQKKGRTVTVVDVEKVETNKQLEQDVKDAETREADRKAKKKKQAVKKEKKISKKKTGKTKGRDVERKSKRRKQMKKIVGGRNQKANRGKSGIMSRITELLRKKAVSKDELVSALLGEFPDKNEKTIRNTVGWQISNLRKNGMEIGVKNGKFRISR